MEYKMNQNAIDELVHIHKYLKWSEADGHWLKLNGTEEVKSFLKGRDLDLDAMNWEQLYENEKEIRRALRWEATSRFDWFRCDVDANCCNRSEYEPLKVEVVE